MDELDVGGKKYISSKRASELTGYAKDYIGQLLRAGKVSGTRFGRAWYVEESEILRHAGKSVVPDVPATVTQETSEISEQPVVLPNRKAEKPLLTHHMITPGILPKTWSSVQYFEDTSDLFPVITPRVIEAVPEKKQEAKQTSEVPVSVHVTRTKASVERRVASLVDGIRPRSAVLRVAAPQIKKITEEKKPRPPARRNVSVHWSAGSFATAIAAFILVFGSFASFFFIKNISAGNPAVLTASTFYGLTDFFDLLKEARILDGGIEALRSFWNLLTESFGVFLRTGLDFVRDLF